MSAGDNRAPLPHDRRRHRPVHERGRKDRFDAFFDQREAYYCGKDYGPRATEIISMGLEALYVDAIGFARKDPEYCKFILGVLSGALR